MANLKNIGCRQQTKFKRWSFGRLGFFAVACMQENSLRVVPGWLSLLNEQSFTKVCAVYKVLGCCFGLSGQLISKPQ